jgi:hypothetical protein
MASTTNYSWNTPDNSGLVKNGAQDMRTLGDAIDASVWNVGFGQSGKNKLINADFNINQRSFTSITTDNVYGFDRWLIEQSGGATYTPQTFTAGAAPVAGYESKNFARIATTGQSGVGVYTILEQKIENVRTFAGQTVTLSLWAKAASAGAKIGLELSQSFGTGGSAQVNTQVGAITLTTSWARYSLSVAVPSISGKTVGTSDALTVGLWTSAGTNFATRASSIGIQTATIDMWGIQLEAGSYATPFQTATNNPANELAACQRYYQQLVNGATQIIGAAYYDSGNVVASAISLPVQMRAVPTLVATSGTAYYIATVNNVNDTFNSFTLSSLTTTRSIVIFNASEASGTAGSAGYIRTDSVSASVGISAEL